MLKNRNLQRTKFQAGFTFIEILVSLAVLVFLAIFIVSGISAFRESAALDQVVDESLELLRHARARTLASENGVSYGVHFATSTITMFSGELYNALDATNTVVPLNGPVQISSIALSTTTGNVVFERLTGKALATGTVSFLTTKSAKLKQIQILPSGLFRAL